MLGVRQSLFLAGACGSLLACGPTGQGKCDPGCPQPEFAELCTGTDSLRFAGTTAGGNLTGVPRVAGEVGWSFLLIDGTCRYWAMTEPDGPIRQGTLDESEQAAFERELELGRWTDSGNRPGCFDASTTRLKFLETETSISCMSTSVSQAYGRWREELHARGTQVLGDARYSVVDASNDAWVVADDTDIAVPWPLATDPSEILVDASEESTAEPELASSDEADLLRAARHAYAASGSSIGPWLRVPVVVDAAGGPRYFNFAMRDTTPYEQAGELSPDEYF